MAFLSHLFNKKKEQTVKTPEPLKTRKDFEETLRVSETQNRPLGGGTLMMAFTQERTPLESEKALLKEVLDIVESSPIGKQLLDQVAALGYTTYFESTLGQNNGSASFQNKSIMLCPGLHTSAASVATTLVHEMVHCVQEDRSGNMFQNITRYKIADQVKYLRAAEAGAWQTEADFAYQIKDRHPEILKDMQKYPMYNAYSAEMDASASREKANAAAFKEWYTFDWYKQTYNQNHLAVITSGISQKISSGDSKSLQKEISNEEILSYAVLTPEQHKELQPAFLNSVAAFSVPEDMAEKITSATEKYNSSFLFKSKKTYDSSILGMYLDGTSKPVAENAAPAKIPASAAPAKTPLMKQLSSLPKQEKNIPAFQKNILKNKGKEL